MIANRDTITQLHMTFEENDIQPDSVTRKAVLRNLGSRSFLTIAPEINVIFSSVYIHGRIARAWQVPRSSRRWSHPLHSGTTGYMAASLRRLISRLAHRMIQPDSARDSVTSLRNRVVPSSISSLNRHFAWRQIDSCFDPLRSLRFTPFHNSPRIHPNRGISR